MNTNNNIDFYSGSGSMNECYQQRNERLNSTGTENLRRFFNSANHEKVERCSLTFRAMNEHRTKESINNFNCRTLETVEFDAEDMKVQPYQYTRPQSNMYEDHREMTVQRPCTDDILIAPPTEIPASASVLQDHVEHHHYTEQPTEPIFHRNFIEVGNEFVPMSGVDETSLAHKKGHTIDTACVECNAVLFSLETASMVVCPFCRCVSPIECHSVKKLLPTSQVHAGIGLPIDFVIALE
jgi:hypothetical protein